MRLQAELVVRFATPDRWDPICRSSHEGDIEVAVPKPALASLSSEPSCLVRLPMPAVSRSRRTVRITVTQRD